MERTSANIVSYIHWKQLKNSGWVNMDSKPEFINSTEIVSVQVNNRIQQKEISLRIYQFTLFRNSIWLKLFFAFSLLCNFICELWCYVFKNSKTKIVLLSILFIDIDFPVQKLLLSHIIFQIIKIYKAKLFECVLYWRETWYLILREKHNFEVFERKVLRKYFGLTDEEENLR
jgi:hypothetical protein